METQKYRPTQFLIRYYLITALVNNLFVNP